MGVEKLEWAAKCGSYRHKLKGGSLLRLIDASCNSVTP